MDTLPTPAEQSPTESASPSASSPATVPVPRWPPQKPTTKPGLVVRIGVTGHRKLRPEAIARLEKQVNEVLQRIATVTDKIYEQSQNSGLQIYSDDKPVLRLISPLADGADRLVARQALAQKCLSFQLQCPMPFPEKEYEKDFQATSEHPKDTTAEFRELREKAGENILELDGDRSAAREAYEDVGRLVLRQCDVLLAVWDEEHEKGIEKVGGTRQIVRESLLLEIPTVWISARVDREPCLLGSIDARQIASLDILDKRLREMFLFTSDTAEEKNEEIRRKAAQQRIREIEAARRFFEEEAQERDYSLPFTWYRDLWCWDLEEKPKRPDPEWRPLFAGNQDFMHRLDKCYRWSDFLASYYGGIFRGSYVSSYLMGAFAVLFAFLGLYFRPLFEDPEWRYLPYFFFGPELLLMIAVFSFTMMGRKKGWHHRWMDYRLLAESLRQAQFLAPLGRITLSFKVPAHLQPGDPRNSWFNWYFRAFIREGGMVRAHFDKPHLDLCRRILLELIETQIEYHHDIAHKLETVSRRSHWFAQGFFIFAAIACGLHLTGEHWQHATVKWTLSFATIVLPAFGAALSAISHHGEFERLAKRSEALATRLTHLRDALPSEGSVSSKEIGRTAEIFSEIMFGETLDWRFAFLDKNLELPA